MEVTLKDIITDNQYVSSKKQMAHFVNISLLYTSSMDALWNLFKKYWDWSSIYQDRNKEVMTLFFQAFNTTVQVSYSFSQSNFEIPLLTESKVDMFLWIFLCIHKSFP